MTSQTKADRSGRIGAIDFWRGVVLIAIFCDHIPGNVWEKATPRNFALSDSAEAFVFLSGVSVALAYFKRATLSQWREVAARCFSRAARIYGVHLLLTVLAVLIFALAFLLSGEPGLLVGDGREFAFAQPARTAVGVFLLSQQLGYFNILPMYVLFMLGAPFALAVAKRSPAALLALSFAVYVGARNGGVTLPSWPEPGVWFFNPLTWQFVFTLGVVCAIQFRSRPLRYWAPVYWASVGALALSAVLVTDGFGAAPGLRDYGFAKLDIDKSHLGLARLLHFLALCYVVAQTPWSFVMKTRFARACERLGRHSLAVFGVGSILAYAGQAVMKVLTAHHPGFASIAGIVYTLLGIACLFSYARRLEGLPLWDLGSNQRGGGGSLRDYAASPSCLSSQGPAHSPRP